MGLGKTSRIVISLASFLNMYAKILSMKQEDNKVGNDSNKQAGQANANNGISGDNTIKNPDNWTTGDEPMTGAQGSYLNTLASEAGETIDENLTKAEASKKIEELQHKTGRGLQQDDQQ